MACRASTFSLESRESLQLVFVTGGLRRLGSIIQSAEPQDRVNAMANEKEREALKQAYPSKRWADKVKKMPDDQVVAVYLRLKKQGKI